MDKMLLSSPLAEELYAVVAESPVIDFHTHLPQDEIYEDKTFSDLWELWLKHDHYKWRLMRGCGVEEKFITGNASPFEKFETFATIIPLAIGNPVHQWAHMELQAVLGISTLLSKDTAREIWDNANEQLQNNPSLSVRGLLDRFNVDLVCTTDDPSADLSTHIDLSNSYHKKVLPTFRPDRFHSVHQPDVFQKAISDLATRCNTEIESFSDLITALKERHDAFDAAGCCLSDHGISYCPTKQASDTELHDIFSKALTGTPATEDEWDAFSYAVISNVASWNTEKDWAMQLHLGPQRNVNSILALETGADSGFDTMGSWEQARPLISFLDQLNLQHSLPKTIVYNLNPQESESICCALQNFQDSKAVGKLQYGPAWWHCDHVRGIREQLDILTSLSAIGTHIGMLTDSRSFTSYVRHDYYRRILASFIADKVNSGEIPNDQELLNTTMQNIAYKNAQTYLKLI